MKKLEMLKQRLLLLGADQQLQESTVTDVLCGVLRAEEQVERVLKVERDGVAGFLFYSSERIIFIDDSATPAKPLLIPQQHVTTVEQTANGLRIERKTVSYEFTALGSAVDTFVGFFEVMQTRAKLQALSKTDPLIARLLDKKGKKMEH